MEAHFGGGSDIDARFAEAEQKRVAMAKEAHISKIEKMAALHEADKKPNGNLEPAEPADQPEKDDREKFGRFDPSSGDQSQKTPRHPVGDSVLRAARHEYEARQNRAFRDRERALIKDVKAKIEKSNKARWN